MVDDYQHTRSLWHFWNRNRAEFEWFDTDRLKFNSTCRFSTKKANIIEVKVLIETAGLALNSFRSGQCSLHKIEGNFHIISSLCFCFSHLSYWIFFRYASVRDQFHKSLWPLSFRSRNFLVFLVTLKAILFIQSEHMLWEALIGLGKTGQVWNGKLFYRNVSLLFLVIRLLKCLVDRKVTYGLVNDRSDKSRQTLCV